MLKVKGRIVKLAEKERKEEKRKRNRAVRLQIVKRTFRWLDLPRTARGMVLDPGGWRDGDVMHIDILPIIPVASRR